MAAVPKTPATRVSQQGAFPRNRWIIALVVTLATFMELLDTSIANVSLPHIAGGLGTSYDEATWVLTSYLVSNAIVLPMSAWLSRVFGRKTYYMMCVGLFTATSFLCGLAAKSRDPTAGAGTARRRRRRTCSGRAGDPGGYFSAGGACLRLRPLQHGNCYRACDWSSARRMDYR
jgi:MFS family permease